MPTTFDEGGKIIGLPGVTEAKSDRAMILELSVALAQLTIAVRSIAVHVDDETRALRARVDALERAVKY